MHLLTKERRDVLRVSFPIVIGIASGTVMAFCDSLMVARISKEAVAALAPAAMWYFTFFCLASGIAGSTNTFVSQCFGAGRESECAAYTMQGIYIGIIALFIPVGVYFLTPTLFALAGHEPDVQRMEVTYLQTRLWGALAGTSSAALAGFFQGTLRPRISMKIAIIANIINLVLDYMLIFGKFGMPVMGVRGAAIATVVARYIEAGLLAAVMFAGRSNSRFRGPKFWKPDAKRLLELTRIGLPSGINYALDVACWSFFNTFIVGRFGSVQLAASNIAMQIMHLSFMPAVGLSIATTSLFGKAVGEKKPERALRYARASLVIAMTYMTCMGLLFFLFRRPLITMFRPESDVVRIGSHILMCAAVFQTFDAVGIVSSGALRGAGDTRWVAIAGLSLAWFVFLPLSYFFAFVCGWQAVGAWVGATIYIWCLAGVLFWRLRSRRWEHIRIFRDEEPPPTSVIDAEIRLEA